MIKHLFIALLCIASSAADAQFVPGQILTANQLNLAFANLLPLTGGTLSGPFAVNGNTILSNLTVNGTFTVPGGFSPSSLAPQAANSLLGNASGSTQVPGVVSVPSCSASGNALKWTTASGFACGTGNALTANPLSQFAATTSAQLAGVISDATGSGSAVFGTSPTLVGPALGTPASGIATNLTGTAAGLTAGNVTTNANLTGPVTSAGNATTIGAGQVTLSNLATEAANTIIGNATSGTSSPIALAIGSCSTGSSALIWTTNTGFGCSTSINAATLGGATFAAPGPIGSTTASTGAFTTLSANSTVSGTGFSTYLASPPAIGTTAPAAGKFTTLQATSTITPSTTAGIVGTTLADNAQAGSVGQLITSTVASGSVSLTNNTVTNLTSISLTAGDWWISGMVMITPAASTTTTLLIGGASATSAALGAFGQYWQIGPQAANIAVGGTFAYAIPMTRINVSTTTTVYLVADAAFAVSSCTAGGVINALRVR